MPAAQIFTGSWRAGSDNRCMDLISIAFGLAVFAALLALVAGLDRI